MKAWYYFAPNWAIAACRASASTAHAIRMLCLHCQAQFQSVLTTTAVSTSKRAPVPMMLCRLWLASWRACCWEICCMHMHPSDSQMLVADGQGVQPCVGAQLHTGLAVLDCTAPCALSASPGAWDCLMLSAAHHSSSIRCHLTFAVHCQSSDLTPLHMFLNCLHSIAVPTPQGSSSPGCWLQPVPTGWSSAGAAGKHQRRALEKSAWHRL